MPASADSQSYRAPQPLMWSSGASAAHHGHGDRRHAGASSSSSGHAMSTHGTRRYANESRRHMGGQVQSNAMSKGNANQRTSHGASGSSSAYSQPSPSSSSVTSTSSSLRTPPDLLLNGSTVASSVSLPSLHTGKGLSGSKGLYQDSAESFRHLSVAQVEDRLKILARLSRTPVTSELPSPPASPRQTSQSSSLSKEDALRKRKGASDVAERQHAASSASDAKERDNSNNKRATQRRSHSPPSDETSMSASNSKGRDFVERARKRGRNDSGRSRSGSDGDNAANAISQLALPRANTWTRERYFETAAAYRSRGRELKHNGDRRMRDAASDVSSSSPRNAMLVAALEQTDALLLYTYAFWCEDQGSGNVVSNNWASLFGLLKYVKTCHDRNHSVILSGLCRLLEANALWHIAGYEMRRCLRRMSMVATTTTSSSSADDSASPSDSQAKTGGEKGTTRDPASSNVLATNSNATIAELSQSMGKALAEQERSARLYTSARQSVLSLAALSTSFPSFAAQCEEMQRNAAWIAADQVDLAMRLDPSAGVPSAEASWSWPIDTSTPFPMLVCFGRALLREAARGHGLSFTTEPVVVAVSGSHATH